MISWITDLALANIAITLAALVQAFLGIGFAMVAVPTTSMPGPSLFAMLVVVAVMGAATSSPLLPIVEGFR